MLMLNGAVVTAFDEATTTLCIFLLELSNFHRILLTLKGLKLPEMNTRSLQQKHCGMDGTQPARTFAFSLRHSSKPWSTARTSSPRVAM